MDAYIGIAGDPAAGIPDQTYEITNLPPLDAYDTQRERFRSALVAAFCIIEQPVRVVFSDELPADDNVASWPT